MNFLKKTVKVPEIKSETFQAGQWWIVKWKSRHGIYPCVGTTDTCEVFFSHEDAIKFKNALLTAFKLVKNTSEDANVIIEKGSRAFINSV
jgi:hypothetical protein